MKPRTIIDPDRDTPRTDAVAKMIGRLACQLKTGELELHAFAIVAQHELDKLGAMERELNAALTKSPAPSKEMEERVKEIAEKWANYEDGQENRFYIWKRERFINALMELAAELGKERAEILALEEENRKLRGQIVSQSPAPSEEMEEQASILFVRKWMEFWHQESFRLGTTNEGVRSLIKTLAAEREAEVATLRAELADRWRDITANEQQTQQLLNDIENLRAEIAELKVELEAERIITTRLQGEIQRLKL